MICTTEGACQKMARYSITREGIIDATVKVIREKGVAGATTRAIVQAVPCAEGTLYLYFKHRTELILAVIETSAGGFVEDLRRLPQHVGQNTVEENVGMIIRQAEKFQKNVLTLLAGVIGDPELLQAQQKVMRKARKGPHLSRLAIAGYLDAEKVLGRVHAQIDSEMIAGLLLRASFGTVFEERFAGTTSRAISSRHMKTLIAALLTPLNNIRYAAPKDTIKGRSKTARKVHE
jgi:AcrR family transcriptional regulator